MLAIVRTTIEDIMKYSNLDAMVKECHEEAGLKGLPEGKLHCPTYAALDKALALTCAKATYNDKLIGYVTVLVFMSPHYSVQLAQIETIYVLKDYRFTRAGIKLMQEAKNIAKEHQVPGLMCNALIGSTLSKLLKAEDYEPTHIVYFMRLNNDATNSGERHNSVNDDGSGKQSKAA